MAKVTSNVLASAVFVAICTVGCGEPAQPASPSAVVATGDAAVHTGTCGPLSISGVTASPNRLWPPNHKFTTVNVRVAASSTCGGVTCSIVSVQSDEPLNCLGDGNTTPDWEISGALQVRLRAERAGNRNGRTYTVNVRCEYADVHVANSSTTVSVTHDQRH